MDARPPTYLRLFMSTMTLTRSATKTMAATLRRTRYVFVSVNVPLLVGIALTTFVPEGGVVKIVGPVWVDAPLVDELFVLVVVWHPSIVMVFSSVFC